jgi:hypothetical protein
MSKELGLLNFICILAALGFLVMIVVTALTAGEILTTDTLFIMTVCLVMAVMFAASPLLYLKSENKLPIPFMKKTSASPGVSATGQIAPAPRKPMLDAKGRAMPADVRAIVANLGQKEVRPE